MDVRTELLYSSVAESLSLVGESTTRAFVWQLNREHISLHPDQVDLKLIESKLLQFFGDGAQIVIDRIYDNFMRSILECEHFDTESIDEVGHLSDDQNIQ